MRSCCSVTPVLSQLSFPACIEVISRVAGRCSKDSFEYLGFCFQSILFCFVLFLLVAVVICAEPETIHLDMQQFQSKQ